jgi:enoyl-CoA hydratase/carnithine racemase
MRFAQQLACGPTKAHAATKRIVKAVSDSGIERADAITPEQFAGLFETEDLQNAVRSFLADGPGNATFEGK